MPKQLNTYVHVAGTVYGPGDRVPPEVAKKITNPAVWTSEPAPAPEPAAAPEPPPAPPAARRSRKS